MSLGGVELRKGEAVRILLTGASGQLGNYLWREFTSQGREVIAWGGPSSVSRAGKPLELVDLANPGQVLEAFRAARASIVIHTAAMAKVADCWHDPERARKVNAEGSAVLAEAAQRLGARLLHVSTDLVFDGNQGWYREQDVPAPLSVYGQTKLAAEAAVLSCKRHVVVRLSLLFGPSLGNSPSFFDEQIAALRAGNSCPLFADEWRTPLSLLTAAQGLLPIARSDLTGMLHWGGPERLSRLEMGQRLAAVLGCDRELVIPTTRASAAAAEPRPRDASLESSRWRALFPSQPWPGAEEALGLLLGERGNR
jgi:dTDP-4-dehydrorhamnose reductase